MACQLAKQLALFHIFNVFSNPNPNRCGCQLCDDSGSLLFWLRPGVRCPCLVAAERPRLVVVCLSDERYPTAPNTGSCSSREFADFWVVAHAYFRPELRCVPKLTSEALRDAHVAWLDPCLCHPKMVSDEIAEVAAFVNQGGGTLVANGFSSFSPTHQDNLESFGSQFKTELMGLKTFARDNFRQAFCYDDPALFPKAPLLFSGPFGEVQEFTNTGESR